uniref:CID domain-containing protein n=1 Tax=Schistosoma haematobium TaxID=6185 RepID=A0A095C0A9_SCHHA
MLANNPSFQLALLYVANEILTKSSKYGVSEFGEALKPVVTQAAQFLKPGPFISKLTKLINYWTYRKVFDTKFTEQLLQKLNATEQVDKKNITPTSHYNSNADSIVKNFNVSN